MREIDRKCGEKCVRNKFYRDVVSKQKFFLQETNEPIIRFHHITNRRKDLVSVAIAGDDFVAVRHLFSRV